MPHALSVTNARIAYGDNVVIDSVDFHVESGDICALVGANGAGKSTLLKGIAGFIPMTYDSFMIDGGATDPSSPRHRDLTFAIMDNFAWLRGLTLWDHYCLIGKDSSKARIHEAMERFDIDAFADRMPYSLSTGQAQRAQLVTMLLRPWQVLFLDEPEQRLDEYSQQILGEVLSSDLLDRTIIMATHSSWLRDEVATTVRTLEPSRHRLPGEGGGTSPGLSGSGGASGRER